MSDALLLVAILTGVTAAFLVSVVVGLVVVAVACTVLSLAFVDGKGHSWRS